MADKNYFDFFDLPVAFEVDEKALKRRFLLNSRKYHPDHFTLESNEKQAEMLELSAQNNLAYKVLKDFDARMEYVLRIRGVLEDGGKNKLPQSFLIEMMEVNEELMELEFEPNEEKTKELLGKVQKIEEELQSGINPIIKAYSDVLTPSDDLEKVKEVFLKKKYLWRIQENLNRFAAASKEVG